jgi:hypothetical protein
VADTDAGYATRMSVRRFPPEEIPHDRIRMRPRDLVHIERGTVHPKSYESHIEIVGSDMGTGPGRIEVGDEPP